MYNNIAPGKEAEKERKSKVTLFVAIFGLHSSVQKHCLLRTGIGAQVLEKE